MSAVPVTTTVHSQHDGYRYQTWTDLHHLPLITPGQIQALQPTIQEAISAIHLIDPQPRVAILFHHELNPTRRKP